MLNPELFYKLKELFGEVQVAGENIPLAWASVQHYDGTLRKRKTVSGEQYRVCCPFCGDTRFRLYISYAWGLDDEVGFPSSKLVICHNERCEGNCDTSDMHFRNNPVRYLNHHLKPYLGLAKRGAVRVRQLQPSEQVSAEPLPYPKPEWVISLDQLMEQHPAVMYLRSRKFDPVQISKQYGVVYCHEYPVMRGEKDYSFLAGRLFIPVNCEGWQARVLPPDTSMKYFTCPGWRKSEALYNIDAARSCGTRYVALFEGVTDVWRAGGPSVGSFGKTLSVQQVKMLAANWDTVAVVYDPDAQTVDPTKGIAKVLQMLSGSVPNVVNVVLPGNKDAGACTTKMVWDCVERQAHKRGLDFVKRCEAPNGK